MGQRNDLAQLFRGEGVRATRTWQIYQPLVRSECDTEGVDPDAFFLTLRILPMNTD